MRMKLCFRLSIGQKKWSEQLSEKGVKQLLGGCGSLLRTSWRWNLSGISVLQRNTGRFKESAGLAEKRRGDHPKEIQKKLIVIKTEDAIILRSAESYGIFSIFISMHLRC